MPTLETRLVVLAQVIGADVKSVLERTSLRYVANGAISGHRVIRCDSTGKAAYADSNTTAHANSVIGISTNAAVNGDIVNVQFSGEVEEPSWNWTPNMPVFDGVNGTLTQTSPTQGFSLVVGFAVTPTKIVVGIKQPIFI